MENADRELIFKVSKSNAQLRRLYDQHLRFEDQISRLENVTFMTPKEQMQSRKLKKQKLQGVDQMMSLIANMR